MHTGFFASLKIEETEGINERMGQMRSRLGTFNGNVDLAVSYLGYMHHEWSR